MVAIKASKQKANPKRPHAAVLRVALFHIANSTNKFFHGLRLLICELVLSGHLAKIRDEDIGICRQTGHGHSYVRIDHVEFSDVFGLDRSFEVIFFSAAITTPSLAKMPTAEPAFSMA